MSDERITQIFAGVVSEFANLITKQFLALDPALRSRLAEVAGSVVQIECTQPALTYYVEIGSAAVTAHAGEHPKPHAIVSGTMLELTAWFAGRPADSLRVTGDATLIEELVGMGKSFAPELADPLRRALGPETADLLRGTVDLGLRGMRSLFNDLGASAKSAASKSFVDEDQLDEFLNEIDELRLRIDRLAAKIAARERGET